MCRANREHKILARWIDLSIEKLLRSNLEILMDQETVKMLSRIKKEDPVEREFIEDLSRSCRA